MSAVATPILTPDDEALAWNGLAQDYRHRAADFERQTIRVLGSGHPAADSFAAFYTAAAADDRDRARFYDDCARAALEGA